MKTSRFLISLLLVINVVSIQAQNLKKQNAYLPKVIKKMKVYLGSSETELLTQCPNCQDQSNSTFDFRKVYMTLLNDDQFQSAIFYVDTDTNKVYEMILIANDDKDVNTIASKLIDTPNHMNKEWRFLPKDTSQSFTIAAWIYKNKLVYAGDLKGTEWEDGFND